MPSMACSPHPRGDGPAVSRERMPRQKFSPPAWGWSDICGNRGERTQVLPTRVGMVRVPCLSGTDASSSPHPRGDGPDEYRRGIRPDWFSPPAWGWSGHRMRLPRLLRVLPTRVGMVRLTKPQKNNRKSSPHPRGDGPFAYKVDKTSVEFSPPAWGWSGGVAAN